MAEANGDGGKFKAYFRKAHAAKLRAENGLVVEPVTFDPPDPQDAKSALTYNDPSGRPLAPVLAPPPLEGPDVTIRAKAVELAAGGRAPAGLAVTADRMGRRWALNNQARAHILLAAHCMVKIEKVYGTIFEGILGEKISTKPVEVVTPFPWVRGERGARVLSK
jgi:hypothetical protein